MINMAQENLSNDKNSLNEEDMTKLTVMQGSKDINGVVNDTTPPPTPGMLKAEKGATFPARFTPSLFKMPMGKEKHERRIMDFPEFLNRINYKSHGAILQKGRGQNLNN